MNRILSATRMQYANAKSYFWVPAVITGGALLVVILIAVIVPDDVGPIYTGAANAPIWFFFAMGIQTLVLTFPFSLALGITRWEFCASTLLAAVGAGAALATLETVLGLLERATDGWGLGAYSFYLPWIWDQGMPGAWLLFASTCIVLFQLGFAFTVIYKRFGIMQLVAGIIVLILLLLVPVWLITLNHAWPRTFQFFAGLTPVGVALGALALSAVITGLGYLALRKYEIR